MPQGYLRVDQSREGDWRLGLGLPRRRQPMVKMMRIGGEEEHLKKNSCQKNKEKQVNFYIVVVRHAETLL